MRNQISMSLSSPVNYEPFSDFFLFWCPIQKAEVSILVDTLQNEVMRSEFWCGNYLGDERFES